MLDWVYPYPVKMTHLPGQVSVAYIDEGAGPQTLVFLHGLGSYLKGWTKNVAELSRDFRCIALDFPGYGKSSKGNLPYSMTFFARIVRDFIRQLNLQNVVLIGHSMGGQVAATFAVRYPDEVQKLVLIAPAGFETFTETDRVWIRSVYSPTLLKAMPADQIRRNFEINFSRFPDDAGFMVDDRMMMQGTKAYEQYCEMIPRCVNSMIDEPVFDLLPLIQAPSLVLFGENDMLIPNKLLHPGSNPVSIAEAGSRQIPGARLELLRPCGHFAQWECAGAVNRSIRRFCEG